LKLKRIGVVAAVVAAGALALSGCSAGSGDTSEIVKGTSITVAQNSGFTSYNSLSGTGDSTYNSNITYMTNSWFNYYDNTPKLVNDTKFGTETLVKKSPLTIKYTINSDVSVHDPIAREQSVGRLLEILGTPATPARRAGRAATSAAAG